MSVVYIYILSILHEEGLLYRARPGKVVAFMGLFNYTSLHVRRNDLQYKEVFIGAQASDTKTGLLRPI